mgnify:CR=1 FL=1|jgi:short-subunit dehydrogenase
METLNSQTIIITGGSLGIGFEVAKACAKNDTQTIIVARDKKNLENAQNELNTISNQKHLSYSLDVSDIESIQTFKHWLLDQSIDIHGLVNCAGIYGPIGKTTTVDMQHFTQAIQINFLGTVYMCNAIAPLLQSKTNKKIINFAGGGAASPFPNYSAYATSKAAIVRFTENLSLELSENNIDINCVAPGFVITRLHQQTLECGPEKSGESFFETTKEKIESGGTSPKVAAQLTTFLLSKESDGISGKFISAPWDPWKDKIFQKRLRDEKDLASLRRIDDKYFFTQKSTNEKSFS